jgi:hypothetical protein
MTVHTMPDKPASSMLDRLRRESDVIRSQAAPVRPVEEVLQDIDRRLWRAYRWLDEALAHLEVIKPVVAHEFRIDALPAMSGLRYERGFVSYRRRHLAGQELLDYVEAFYRLTGAAPVVLKVPPSAAGAIEERLRAASIPFAYAAEHDERRQIVASKFTVTPQITSSVRFDPDYRRQRIEVRLTNIDRFESVRLEFTPETFDEPAIEDLMRFLLGESNAFLRRAPLCGVGANKRAEPMPEDVVYRVEKTVRHR